MEADDVLPGMLPGYPIDYEAITTFANALGDMNPLYNDPGYAGKKTRYSGIIAPPTYVTADGLPEPLR